MALKKTKTPDLSLEEYRSLAEFRYQIRRFVQFSEEAARISGIEPHQHQLLLAIKGTPPEQKATIRFLASRLCIRHNSTVELVNRLAERGAVKRVRGQEDRREVLIHLTPSGERLLRQLSLYHREEIQSIGPALAASLDALIARNLRSRRRT